ncbi:MAG: HDIG domain-containing protein [Phycisphaera sp.]|nr:HDIG domain-containing protein [Phycisphaera sp.]
MSVFKGSTSRRREVRKAIPRQRNGLRELVTRGQFLWGALMTVLIAGTAGTIALKVRDRPEYLPGQLVDRAQVARVAFESLNLEATKQAKENAAAKEPAVYVPNTQFLEATKKKLETLPAVAASAERIDQVAEDIRVEFGLTDISLADLRQFQADGKVLDAWIKSVEQFMFELHKRAILSTDRFQIEQLNLAPYIRLMISDNLSTLIYHAELVHYGDETQVRTMVEGIAKDFPASIRKSIGTYFIRAKQPTYRFDQAATDKVRAEAAKAVQPTLSKYEPNQTIVESGKVLEEPAYRLLQKEHETYTASLSQTEWLFKHLGPLVLILGLSIGLVGYIATVKPRVAQNPMRGLSLSALLVACLALAMFGVEFRPDTIAAGAVAPVLLSAFILAIAYDQRLALGVGVLLSLLVGLSLDLSVGLVTVSIFGSMVAIAQLHDVRHRSTLVRVGFVTGVVMGVTTFAYGWTERNAVEGMMQVLWRESVFTFVGCLFVGFFVLGTLPFIERLFRVTTAMTLLELGDMNRPLLRRLAQSAPGTFNHSLQVANLAAAAAEAIGANSLLARVGAYYHDIGKIHKPQYFVENQGGGPNRHDKLSPAMSLLIIVGHVKDGMEMAREYGLPPVLYHFIESHHGTTLVEYFYHAAKKQKGEDDQPEEIEFRYPGPKPQTKEAGILMLCDCVESASRTMPDPTPARIEQLVHKLATKRLADGQFDECDVTLRELHQVEQALTKSLCAVYHGRVAYPEAEKPSKPAREKPEEQGERRAV